MMRRVSMSVSCLLAISLASGCDLLDPVHNPNDGGVPSTFAPVANRPLDILFVIDNSGSMREEQLNLALHASSIGSQRPYCNQTGFDQLRNELATNGGLSQDSPEQWPSNLRQIYDDCGFIERLLLHDNKFHLGVITTDSGDCDRPLGSNSERGSEPQRGCLHTSPADPGLTVLKWDTPDLPQKFYDIVTNVLTYGNAYEKGLQGVRDFLTPGHSVPSPTACDLGRDCAGDYQAFWRDAEEDADGDMVETGLVIVFVTDEEDCSHGSELDENISGNTELCYTRPDLLTPVEEYVDFIRSLKSDPQLVSAVLIAGLHDSGNGLRPGGCQWDGSAITDLCTPPHGNSVATCLNCGPINEPVCMCHPEPVTCGNVTYPAANCCTADAAPRYFQLVTGLPRYELFSICSSSFFAPLQSIPSLPL